MPQFLGDFCPVASFGRLCHSAAVLIRVRQIPSGMKPRGEPTSVDGLEAYGDATIGNMVRIPAALRDAAERAVGSLSLGAFFPLGIEFQLDPPDDQANGLWVQESVYRQVKAEAAKPKAKAAR